jgi:1-acyl-sn-glycerol-3-phosphate acyltransferase
MFKTVVFFVLVWFSLLILMPLGVAALPFIALGLRAQTQAVLHFIGRWWARLVIAGIGVKVTVVGQDRIPREGGVCFVGNHPGDFDTILALAYIGRPFGFTAKKEVLFYPFMNLFVWLLGGLFIDRGNPRNALKSLKKGAQRIQAGFSMIIFPEGTRNRGGPMLPFKSGALKLASFAGAPIVPVSILGSHCVWEEHHRIRAASIKLTFSHPIPTAGLSGDQKRLLADQVLAAIQEPADA